MGQRDAADRPQVNPTDEAIPKTCTYAGTREVLRSRDVASKNHEFDWELFGGSIITIDGKEHLRRRRLQSVLFKPMVQLAYEQDVLEPTIEAVLDEATEDRGADGVVRADLVQLTRRIMLSVAAAIIGLDDVESPGRRERLGECLDQIIEGVLVEWATEHHRDILDRALEAKAVFVEEFLAPALEARRRKPADEPTDLLSVLLSDPDHEWSAEEIYREAVLYLVASTLTTSTTTTHTVHHLEDWLVEHPDDRSRLRDPDLLSAVAAEGLRLHPAPHILLRRAEGPMSVKAEGLELDEGGFVGADLRAANRDPAAYGEHTDRFDPTRRAEGAPPEGLTFGGGRHLCIGRPLALGTYRAGDDVETYGLLVRMIRGLYAAGIQRDKSAAPTKPASVHDRYATYPVVFSKL